MNDACACDLARITALTKGARHAEIDISSRPARGAAARIKKGQRTHGVINTHGSQVVDFWAFNDPDLGECMSMEHSRPTSIGKIMPGGRATP